jgi:hypothetical protein
VRWSGVEVAVAARGVRWSGVEVAVAVREVWVVGCGGGGGGGGERGVRWSGVVCGGRVWRGVLVVWPSQGSGHLLMGH